MSKLIQLELELKEMQQRVSKLEELFSDLAKWTDFQKQITDEETVSDNDQDVEILEDVSEKSTESAVDPLPIIQPTEPEDENKDCEDIEEFKIEITDDEKNENSTSSDLEEHFPSSSATDLTTRRKPSVTKTFAPLQLPQSFPQAPLKIKMTHPPLILSPFAFASKIRMMRLSRYQHAKKPKIKFKCYFCQKSYSWKITLKEHIRMHTREHPYKCSHCKYTAQFSSTLNLHLRSEHRIKPFVCGLCPETFKLRKQLRDHKLQIHGPKIQCPQCNFTCEKLQVFNIHLRTHTGERPFSCRHCSYAGATNHNLQEHIRHIHPANEERPFACQQCPCRFRFKQILNMHVKNQHNEKESFLCHHCPYITTTKGSLTSHIKLVHSVFKEEDYFNCYFCSRKFKCLSGISVHMRTHTGECPYKCPICPFSADQTARINNHVRIIHNSDQTGRDFKCTKCPSAFNTQRHLSMHSKLHGKTFKYTVCNKRVLSSAMLLKHKKEEHPNGIAIYNAPAPKMP